MMDTKKTSRKLEFPRKKKQLVWIAASDFWSWSPAFVSQDIAPNPGSGDVLGLSQEIQHSDVEMSSGGES